MSEIIVPEKVTSRTADAVVIGGGIVGTATAFWLSKAGMRVIVVEKRNGLSTLTTVGSVECFRTQFTEKAMAELVLPSVEMFENFKDVVGLPDIDIGITQQGYLFVTDDPAMVTDLEKAFARYAELGVPGSELLTESDLHKRFPFLAPDALAATFNNRDGWISTHETTYGFAKGAQDVQFFIRTQVTDLLVDGKGICGVKTDKGTLHTRLVVNCAGPYAGVVAKMAKRFISEQPVSNCRLRHRSPWILSITATGVRKPEGFYVPGWTRMSRKARLPMNWQPTGILQPNQSIGYPGLLRY